jgi:hypothetical protein
MLVGSGEKVLVSVAMVAEKSRMASPRGFSGRNTQAH